MDELVSQRLHELESRIAASREETLEFRDEVRANFKEGRDAHDGLRERMVNIEKKQAVHWAYFVAAVAIIQFLMGAGSISLKALLK